MAVSDKALPGLIVRVITAVLLAVILLFGLQSPTPARAEVSAWQALQEEIDHAEDGDVITLSEDIIALDGDTESDPA